MTFDEKKYIGNKIRTYRKKRKLTQEQLAELVGLCEKHIGQIERGAYSPTLSNFFKITKVLQIDLSEFGLCYTNEETNTLRSDVINILYNASDKELHLYHNIITGAYNALKYSGK